MRTSAAMAPLFGREHRIQVHLGDLGKVRRSSCDTFCDRSRASASRFDRVGAAHALQAFPPRRCRRASTARRRRVAGASRNVMSFRTSTSTPPKPNATQLAERRIGDGADDDFLAARRASAAPGRPAGSAFASYFFALAMIVAKPASTSAALLHADQHAAGLGLVQDLRRDDLQHDREAHRRRRASRRRRRSSRRLPSAPGCRRRRRRACLRAPSATCGRRP